MLTVDFIKNNEILVKANIYNRGDVDLLGWNLVDQILELDDERRELITTIEGNRAKHNKLGKNDKEQASKLKIEIQEQESYLKNNVQIPLNIALANIPNMIKPEVPGSVVGHGENIYCNPKTGYRFSDKIDIVGYAIYLIRNLTWSWRI